MLQRYIIIEIKCANMQKTIICNENAINRVKYADKIEKTVDF